MGGAAVRRHAGAVLISHTELPLVGRDQQLAAAGAQLAGGTRLLTIVGPGGVGKTRLARELMVHVGARYDSAASVSCVASRVGDDLVAQLAAAVGAVGADVDSVALAVAFRRTLVVLDNLEQVEGADESLAAVLAVCPQLTLVATSRRRLRVAGEATVALGPLPVPAAHDDAAAIAASPAVRLFCAAAGVETGSATAETLRTVAEICRHLDGLPLALDLAAASTRLITLDDLLRRLGTAAPFEVRRRRPDDEDRHSTLDAAIDWSSRLLSPAAQRLLAQLSVFSGSWTLDALDAVVGDGYVGDGRSAALDVLGELVDLHLVERTGAAGPTARFTMLETVRAYARRALGEGAELAVASERHAAAMLQFVARAGPELSSRHQVAWFDATAAELDNLRAARDWLGAAGRHADAVALTTALGVFWMERGNVGTARTWLETDLAAWRRAGEVDDFVLAALADVLAVRLAIEVGTAAGGANGTRLLQRLEQARDVLAGAGRRREWLRATGHLVYVLRVRGEQARALALADAVLVETVDDPTLAWECCEVAHIALLATQDLDAHERGAELTRLVTSLARRCGHERLALRAVMVNALGSGDVAADVLEHAYARWIALGDHRSAANAAALSSVGAARAEDWEALVRWSWRGIDSARRVGYWHGIGFGAVAIWGVLGGIAGRHADAAVLSGALHDSLDEIVSVMPPVVAASVVSIDDHVRRHCDPADYARGFARGASCSRSELVEILGGYAESLLAAPIEPPSPRRRGPRANPEPTDRELEILRHLVDGKTNAEIAVALALSPKTVMHHTTNIYRKLGVRGRAEAAAVAVARGLVEPR